MPKISVLVAVYNTASYLPKCLDSLLGQTLADIEVICVDDASTDGSTNILREYADTDNRIKIILQNENKGQAHARNVGLNFVKSDYVCFVDSDDWLADDALEQVYTAFSQPEVDSVLFRVVRYFTDNKQEVYPMLPFDTMDGKKAFEASLTWKIHGVYAIRNEIHQRYPYDESQRAYSDDNITRIHYLLSRKVALCGGTYYYRQHAASVTHRVSVRRFDYLRANESMAEQLKQLRCSSMVLCQYETVRWLNLVDMYLFYYLHRSQLGEAGSREGLDVMRHTWETINLNFVDKNITRKFGYMPFRRAWLLFRCQEEVYFFLRKVAGRNQESS